MSELQTNRPGGAFLVTIALLGFSAIATRAQVTYSVTDLGSIQGSLFTDASGLNEQGLATGTSFISLSPEFETQGFVSQDGQITLLPALGGQFTFAAGINSRAHVVGTANLPGDRIGHASLWINGKVFDLGTLGGISSGAAAISNNEEIAGDSQISEGANFHAFFLGRGPMIDIGTLGGDNSFAFALNNRGLVTGQSDTTTVLNPLFGIPAFHGFLWSKGLLTDLGQIFGTDFNYGNDVNDRDQVAGAADLPGDQTAHAFLLNDGKIQDLAPLAGDTLSAGFGINNRGQVVGVSSLSFVPAPFPPVNNFECPCHAVIWEDGKATDLNTLIPANSGWQLFDGVLINDRGQIAGDGMINNELHAFLLTPQHGTPSRTAAAAANTDSTHTTISPDASPFVLGGLRVVRGRGRISIQPY